MLVLRFTYFQSITGNIGRKLLEFVVFILVSITFLVVTANLIRVHASIVTNPWVWELQTYIGGALIQPYRVTIDASGNIYVLDMLHQNPDDWKVKVFNSSKVFQKEFEVASTTFTPSDLVVDTNGDILVTGSDTYTYTNTYGVDRYDNDGNFLSHFSTVGSGYCYNFYWGQSWSNHYPSNIFIDSLGNIYVTDGACGVIHKFTNAGGFLNEITNQDGMPNGLAIDTSGAVYTLKFARQGSYPYTFTNYLKKFNSSLALQWTVGGVAGCGVQDFGDIHDLIIDSQNNIYVIDTGCIYSPPYTHFQINRFSAVDGSYLGGTGAMGRNGTSLGSFSSPLGLAVDSGDNIYVADERNARIQKFSSPVTLYQISNLNSSLAAVDPVTNMNIQTTGSYGVSGANEVVRLTTDDGIMLADSETNMTTDRSWPNVIGDSDREAGKSYTLDLTGEAGTAGTHTLYVPIPPSTMSDTVHICPDAGSLTDVSLSCSNGISRSAGSYSESFGSITISQIQDATDGNYYWKIVGLSGSGGTSEILPFSGGGLGTQVDPYEIGDCMQLQEMENHRAAYYEQLNNIDCSFPTFSYNDGFFTPVGSDASPFTGGFIGNYHNISGLTINIDPVTTGTGLFSYTDGATLENIYLVDINYSVHYLAGALIGSMNNGSVSNCHASGTITGSPLAIDEGYAENWGGLIGNVNGSADISGSSSSVNIDADQYVRAHDIGGFIGATLGPATIENSHATGTIHFGINSYEIGGFIGLHSEGSLITNSSASGEVHVGVGASVSTYSNNYDIGGFVGAIGADWPGISATIQDSSSSGALNAEGTDSENLGGFAGAVYWESVITGSHSSSVVTVGRDGYEIGGFVGYTTYDGDNPVQISDSYSSGNVSVDYGAEYIGGFIGEVEFTDIENCYSTGNVSVGSIGNETEWAGEVGGFIGNIGGDINISDSYSTGSVDTIGEVYNVGGFIGEIYGNVTIETSASLGDHVIGYSDGWDGIGGFLGYADGNIVINNCYTRTDVEEVGGNVNAGGFIGYDDYGLTVTNSYAANVLTVVGTPDPLSTGGFLGMLDEYADTPIVTSSYWDTGLTNWHSNDFATPLSTLNMKIQGSYVGWDFGTIWGISSGTNDGYPTLQGPLDEITPTPSVSPTPIITPALVSFELKDTLTRLQIDTLSNHNLQFGTNYAINHSGDYIVVTFSDWTFVSLGRTDLALYDDEASLALADTVGTDVWGVTISGDDKTITLEAPSNTGSSQYIAEGSVIRLEVNNNKINNPLTADSYTVNYLIHTFGPVTETGQVNVPIVDSDQVDVTGYVTAFMSFDIDTGTGSGLAPSINCDSGTCKLHGGIGAAAGDNYTVDLGELKSTYINASNDDEVMHSDGIQGAINSIYFDLSTNANGGVVVTVTSATNNGLVGPSSNIIPVTDENTITTNSGKYGFNVADSSSVAGEGVVTNSSCNVVDLTHYCGSTTTPKQVFNTTGSPIDTARVRMDIAAAATYINLPGNYTDTLTFVATATF